MIETFDIMRVKGHFEVYINGMFVCSADTYTEAARELETARWTYTD